MVDPTNTTLIAVGFSLELRVSRLEDSWADCVALLKCEASSEELDVRSVPFYMSGDEFKRLAQFIDNQLHVDCDDRNPFVPTSLGFELTILDADEVEATVQALLNVGMCNGSRVYAGSRSQVRVAELHQFAICVATMGRDIVTPDP